MYYAELYNQLKKQYITYGYTYGKIFDINNIKNIMIQNEWTEDEQIYVIIDCEFFDCYLYYKLKKKKKKIKSFEILKINFFL